MTDRDVLIAFVSSLVGAVIGGFVVLATEQIVSILKERRKTRQGRVVRDPNAEKRWSMLMIIVSRRDHLIQRVRYVIITEAHTSAFNL